jgi:hypothetical protein
MRKRLASPLPLIDSVPLGVVEAAKRIFETYTARLMLSAEIDFPMIVDGREDRPGDDRRYWLRGSVGIE